MPSLESIVLEGAGILDFLQHVLDCHAPPSTLVVCSTKTAFIESLEHAAASTEAGLDEATLPTDRMRRLWRTPTLRLLSTSRTLKLVFCPDITHLRAYLATYSLALAKRPHDADTALRYKSARPVLAVLDLIQVHRPTTAFSAQGINRSISAAVEAALATESKLILAEYPARLDQPDPDLAAVEMDVRQAEQPAWDEAVPILNVTTKRLGELSVGRTVAIRTVAARWCTFERLGS
ncbi:uncharacterized protein MYCFIDRAFT_157368 [Pseudocercospora fijiensis CIRAD86]|uniref:Uncharacterized protein n=1 Tax=Pseudocercospora fijiensis (strain CIRAD86) TaxID=383855 RepID=M3AMC1_PSEFD|nr:uncharacterized protein MYCFIDRAFT_157368 [Pseudocercospora fijiensis CIRAD86]EME78612.1 hypothetical protein MYCFIDRAFT_157368 [Pseudocercospora fijiensis CIRAD86]